MFNPLSLIFVAFSEALILGQPLGLGTYQHFSLLILYLHFQCLLFHESYHCRKIGNSKSVCRLGGMVLIITGLYFFLWGKNNDTHKNVAAAEGSTMMIDGLTATQSTSAVLPSASPTDSVLLEIENTENS